MAVIATAVSCFLDNNMSCDRSGGGSKQESEDEELLSVVANDNVIL